MPPKTAGQASASPRWNGWPTCLRTSRTGASKCQVLWLVQQRLTGETAEGRERRRRCLHPRTAGKRKDVPAELGTLDAEDIRGRSSGLSMSGNHADHQQHRRPIGHPGYPRTPGPLACPVQTAPKIHDPPNSESATAAPRIPPHAHMIYGDPQYS